MDLPDSDRGDFSCRRAVDSSSFEFVILGNIKYTGICKLAISIYIFTENQKTSLKIIH